MRQTQGLDIDRIADRLLATPEPVTDLLTDPVAMTPDWAPPEPFDRPPVIAAVLIALVAREGGHGVLYTERAPDLRTHSGQIAFPGGKIDAADRSAAAAALREAHEEVALNAEEARVIGYLPSYFTGTNYLITPVVAEVRPKHPFVANPGEVAGLFEVPLMRLARPETYGRYKIARGGRVAHETWRIDHAGHTIWGITANLTRRFFETALRPEQ